MQKNIQTLLKFYLFSSVFFLPVFAAEPTNIQKIAPLIPFHLEGHPESLSNGTLYYGKISLQGTQFPGMIIDYKEPFDEANLVVLLHAPLHTQNWSRARSYCQQLGDDWDLPAYERRFQVTAGGRFAVSSGEVSDPLDRKNGMYAFWSLGQNEEINQSVLKDSDLALVITSPVEQSNSIIYKISTQSTLMQGGVFWIDGFLKMGPKGLIEDLTYVNYEVTLAKALHAKLPNIIATYFLNPEKLDIALRKVVSNYLKEYPDVHRGLDAAIKSGQAENLRNFIDKHMVNWEEIFTEPLRGQSAARLSRDVVRILHNLHNSSNSRLSLYCMREIPKNGILSQMPKKVAPVALPATPPKHTNPPIVPNRPPGRKE